MYDLTITDFTVQITYNELFGWRWLMWVAVGVVLEFWLTVGFAVELLWRLLNIILLVA